jgi:serine protease Do
MEPNQNPVPIQTEQPIIMKPKQTKVSSSLVISACALVASVASITMSGATLVQLGQSNDTDKNSSSSGYNGSYYDGNSVSLEETTIEGIAEKVSPSVVSITTETRSSGYFGVGSSTAAGTGIIVTADGYILTNKHVVDGASKVAVTLDNGDSYKNVTIVGTDPINDVAFIKINDAQGLPAADLGDSKTLRVGQPVMAVGNALGQFQNTITQGVVSGLGRSITASDGAGMSEELTDMIQTDASINPGNSGGPLVNAAGQVIGMNTAVSNDANGIGFAIPISTIKGMLKYLIATGEIARAYIGVYYQNITPDIAEQYGLSVKAGAYVYNDGKTPTASGSPAARAGLQSEDIITKVAGAPIGKSGSLSALLSEFAVGDTVDLTVLRSGSEITLTLTISSYPK